MGASIREAAVNIEYRISNTDRILTIFLENKNPKKLSKWTCSQTFNSNASWWSNSEERLLSSGSMSLRPSKTSRNSLMTMKMKITYWLDFLPKSQTHSERNHLVVYSEVSRTLATSFDSF